MYPLPDSVDLTYGAMMEPLSVAVHAIANVGSMRTGYNVLVMGAGPVGVLAMGVAKGLGAGKIIAVDINEERLNFAKQYAATHIYVPVRRTSFHSFGEYWTDHGFRPSRRRTSLVRCTHYARPLICCLRPGRRREDQARSTW